MHRCKLQIIHTLVEVTKRYIQYTSGEMQVFPTCTLRSVCMWKEHVEALRKDVAVRAGGRKDKDLAETQDCWSHLLVAALAEERVSRQQ